MCHTLLNYITSHLYRVRIKKYWNDVALATSDIIYNMNFVKQTIALTYYSSYTQYMLKEIMYKK